MTATHTLEFDFSSFPGRSMNLIAAALLREAMVVRRVSMCPRPVPSHTAGDAAAAEEQSHDGSQRPGLRRKRLGNGVRTITSAIAAIFLAARITVSNPRLAEPARPNLGFLGKDRTQPLPQRTGDHAGRSMPLGIRRTSVCHGAGN